MGRSKNLRPCGQLLVVSYLSAGFPQTPLSQHSSAVLPVGLMDSGSALAYGAGGVRSHDVAIRIPFTNIILPLRTTNNLRRSKRVPKLPMGGAVAEQMDFTREADGCFRLAESETHAEVRTLLMGMGYGWLTLANHQKASGVVHHEPFEEPTDEPADDMV
jgi:hypothetical protein